MNNFVATVLTPLVVGIAKSLLHSLAQSVWDSLWACLIDAIKEVETKLKDGDYSAKKKEQVITAVIEYLSKHRKMSKVQLWAVRSFISRIIDKMIDEMNRNYSHTWVETITDLKQYWAGRIPLVD